jgi:hypothetical protein
MALTVKERGELTATYRFIEVKLMETLAEWVPTTPEMEIKLLFGAHIWDVAQHADSLGKRTYELRLPLQFSLRPSEEYIRILEELCEAKESSDRIAGFYDVMLPALAVRFQNYLNQTDSLMDAPSVRILERILQDNSRMIRESKDLREQLKLQAKEGRWADDLARKESSIETVVAPKTAA